MIGRARRPNRERRERMMCVCRGMESGRQGLRVIGGYSPRGARLVNQVKTSL